MQNSSGTTIRDIARHAGVSKATVSLVMNGSPKVSAKTRAEVWAVVHGLDYHPSEEARKLAQRRWSSLAVVPATSASPDSIESKV